MAKTPTYRKIAAIQRAVEGIEDVSIRDVTVMGHPDPSRCDLGFTVWIKGTSREEMLRIAEAAD